MPEFAWFIPTAGDGFYIGRPDGWERAASFSYATDVARAAESAGFTSALIFTNIATLDPWITASAVLHSTRSLVPLVALRPGFMAPTVAAKMASSLDVLSNGRISLNIVTGGNPWELAADGDFLSHDERYQRTEEFIRILLMLWEQADPFDFTGTFYTLKGARLIPRPTASRPHIFVAGASPQGYQLAAKYADTYLMWGEPVDAVRGHIDKVSKLAGEHGRTLRFGLRVNIIMRPSDAEAWAAARTMISQANDEVRAAAAAYYQAADSHGQKRLQGLLDAGEVLDTNLWTGLSQIKPGNATALVGAAAGIEASLRRYMAAGIDYFILSGFPHLEEAARIGRELTQRFPG